MGLRNTCEATRFVTAKRKSTTCPSASNSAVNIDSASMLANAARRSREYSVSAFTTGAATCEGSVIFPRAVQAQTPSHLE
ncbi:unannotated protein [freshwater metagenome]|uniref:Unannotated protein n=1 Tax=freshwater metagenome TaxID=449393 RepID=A0A6J6XSQ2_9ZZZZ